MKTYNSHKHTQHVDVQPAVNCTSNPRWMVSSRFYSLVLVLLVLSTSAAFADSITIYNTGQANSSSGQVDANYTLVSAPAGSGLTTPGPAFTIDAYGGWVGAPSGSWWINPYSSSYGDAAPGWYEYEMKFDLAGLAAGTASLTGSWAVDNSGYITLNGNNTGITLSNFGGASLTPFTINSGFQDGVNTLDFWVYNNPSSTGHDDPTGLLVEISGTASPSPEPSSLVLLGSGLLGIVGTLRRRLIQ